MYANFWFGYTPFLSDSRDLTSIGGHEGLVYHHCKIWELALHRMKAPSTHAHTPLWGNPCLPTLLTLPDIEVWITHGVIYLSQIYSISVRSFKDLKLAFNMFFHFFQLRHMLLVQFGDSIHNLTSLYPLDVFLGADSKK